MAHMVGGKRGAGNLPKTIPADSTIASVFQYLTHKDNYVRWALQKMRECNKAHGNSSIKIGVTGTGQKPYYRITYKANGEKIFGSFYDNHEPLEIAFADTSNWSRKSMTFDELLNFYADAIGHKGKRI
jgi:hypothetical protein